MNNKKRIIIISIASAGFLIGLIIGGYFFLNYQKQSKKVLEIPNNNAASDVANKATQGVLPSITANPMENKPDINPVGKANPIKNIKVNPFE